MAKPLHEEWTYDDITEVRRRIVRWREDKNGPIKFVREAIGLHPNKHQQELLQALWSFTPGQGKFGVSVASGQGCGKTTGAAMGILWFLTVFENAFVYCTAPTEKQLHSVLWGELDKQIRGSAFLNQFLEWRATRVQVRGGPLKWAAVAKTARDVEGLQGEHAEHMLVVIDEASGVEDRFLEALLGGLSEPHNLALMISNPTLPYGTFYESHHDDNNVWHTLQFSARESNLVSKAHIERMETKYGKDSAIVQVRIDGQFPHISENTLINRADMAYCKEREEFDVRASQPWYLGCDVARFGSDMTAICIRHGQNVKYLERWHGNSVAETCGIILQLLQDYPMIQFVNIDSIGVGGGLVDMLQDQQNQGLISPIIEIIPVDVAENAARSDEYVRLRDELWFTFADRVADRQLAFSKEIDPDLVEQLIKECLPVEYAFTADGRRRVDSKDDMKKKIDHSPDITDAALLAFHEYSAGFIGFVDMSVR